MLKPLSYLFLGVSLLIAVFGAPNSHTNSNGAPAGYTGSMGDSLLDCSSCHSIVSYTSNQNPTLTVSSTVDEYYLPGETYEFTISIDANWVNEFGFLACLENESGDKIGELQLVDPVQTQLISNGDYVTHTSSGTVGMGQKTWTFNWVAPSFLQEDITVYVSTLLSNDNGVNNGDGLLTASQTYLAPFLGCLDEAAINFNSNATYSNGSCLYGLSNATSPLSLSYDSEYVYGTTNDYELETFINVHNYTDSNLVVYTQRNILSESIPSNWFCWNVCYLPTVSTSPLGVSIPAGSYTNSFSAHLVPLNTGGTYDVEYCFYTEGNIEDSICATVHFVVEGEIPGCMDINAINYNIEANTDDGSCIIYPQPNWNFIESNAASHSIAITLASEILINDEPISIGDWIGVFYNSDEGLVCGGFTEWTGVSNYIQVQGFDQATGFGFNEGTEFTWRVWDASEGVSWPMDVTYSIFLPQNSQFVTGGISAVTSMYNINPIVNQTVNLPDGWSLFSTYMITQNMDVSAVFELLVDDIVIVKDNDGWAYLVEYDYNAIGDLIPGQGYLVKTTAVASVYIEGAYAKPELNAISLQDGWNMVGYLKTEPENAIAIFSDLVAEGKIQIVKDYLGNAYMPNWNFNGIGEMQPGQGYQVKTFEPGILQY